MIIIVKCNNGIVTDNYLEIIGEALTIIDDEIIYVNSVNDVYAYDKQSIIVVARIMDAISVLGHGYKKMIMWFQGVEPEESYMAHGSFLREFVLSFLEKRILKKAMFYFFVSEEMRSRYIKKYKISIQDNYYCMPCLNTDIHVRSFYTPEKYTNNYFAYVGSMAVWQKFEDTVSCYKKIEMLGLPNTKLFVFTSEAEKAKEVIEKYGIRNFAIDFVDNSKLDGALGEIKYGFIIREDTTVNRVATPTKISTYLSCGLIPIYSECLCDFNKIAKNMKYVVTASESLTEKISSDDFLNINPDNIFSEYKCVFETYYSRTNHIKKIREQIGKCLVFRSKL